MSRTHQFAARNQDSTGDRRLGTRLFLVFLTIMGSVYGLILALHLSYPRRQAAAADSFLERCRELCLNYGLIPTGHVADDAQAYLAVAKPQDLISPLNELLSDTDFSVAESMPHPLLGLAAPDFQLLNDRGENISLKNLNDKGPVVVVFYYGYSCSHCVAQLFGLQQDLAYLRELGAEVVALSADSPEHTAKRFGEYGRFDFPVLSDTDNKVAEAWGVFTRATTDQQEDRLHGTFLVDRTGRVVFANYDYQPFLDNKSLLYWLADKRPSARNDADGVTSTGY